MKPKDIIQLLTLAAIWGSSYMFLRIVVPTIGVPSTIGLRITIAAIFMVALFAYLHKLPEFKQYWKQYLVLGLVNLVAPFALMSFAVSNLNASLASILNATTPLFTMIVSSLWLGEKMRVRKVLGLSIGIVGLIVLVGWIPLAVNTKVILSIIFALIASLLYGLAAVYTRVYLAKSNPFQTATGQLGAAAIVLLPFLPNSFSNEVFTFNIIIVVLILAIISTAIAYALYFRLLSNIGSTNASLVTLLVPLFSLLWSVIFLDEPVTASLIIGMLLILFSLKLIITPAR